MIDIGKAKGVIFDLDGTLVSSTLNFTMIREQIGCPQNEDLLVYIDNLETAHQRSSAHDIVRQHELKDAENATWLNGAKEFVFSLVAQQLPLAIVTRNCPEATQLKIKNNAIPIDVILTREDAAAKPDPEALLRVAKSWQIAVNELIYVGDYIYDEQAAANAGMPFAYSPFS